MRGDAMPLAQLIDGCLSACTCSQSTRSYSINAIETMVNAIFGFMTTFAFRMQHFLYFFPLPQGQGSLRPTFSMRLRIGSIFFSASVPAIAACCCRSMSLAGRGVFLDRGRLDPRAADEAFVELLHLEDQIGHVRCRPRPTCASNSFMPSRLYSTFGSTWA